MPVGAWDISRGCIARANQRGYWQILDMNTESSSVAEEQDAAVPSRVASPAPATPPAMVHIEVSRRRLIAIAFVLLAPWVVLLLVTLGVVRPASVEPVRVQTPVFQSEQMFRCNPGPWGDLEFTRFAIGPPREFLPTRYVQESLPRWVFTGWSREQVGKLFDSAGLTNGQRRALEQESVWEINDEAVVVMPHVQAVLGLDPHARRIIYSALAGLPGNDMQANPFLYRAGAEDEWLAHASLSPQTVEMVKSLLYRRGNTVFFSDLEAVAPLLPSNKERVALLETLSRKSTLMAKLRILPDSDLEEVIDYWSIGGRAKDVRPLLESLPRLPGGFTVDIAHLLPPLPRKLLYTYPLPQHTEAGAARDCFWTSFNFFSETPNDRVHVLEERLRLLQEEYYPAPSTPRLGDVLVFLDSSREMFHACVYIADDIVYTKNGLLFSQPWILMTLDDLMASYPSDDIYEIVPYRPRFR
jgi:hypothetical protein